MEIGESTRSLRSRGRGKITKCVWSEEETQALVDALRALAFEPKWRTDSGFRNGYLAELHKRILAKLPTFSKQADPHIGIKVKQLKNKFNAINEMSCQSGCGWNYAKKKIQCEREWYEDWVKTHKKAKGLWDVKFPYLEALEVVYGKARRRVKTEEATIDLEGVDEEEHRENSETLEMNSRKKKNSTRLGRNNGEAAKRTRESTVSPTDDSQLEEAMSKKVGVLIDSLATIASTLANKDKREQLREEKANTVVEELMKLGLLDRDMFRAADMLSANYHKLNVFSQLSLDQKRHYVVEMLYPSSYHACGGSSH